MGGRCRKVGELAARHWRSLCVFGAFLVLDASFAEDLRFRGPSTPLWLQNYGGGSSDGRESRWTRETRTIGRGGPVSAPGREAGACWALVDPDRHHRSPAPSPSRPLLSGGGGGAIYDTLPLLPCANFALSLNTSFSSPRSKFMVLAELHERIWSTLSCASPQPLRSPR